MSKRRSRTSRSHSGTKPRSGKSEPQKSKGREPAASGESARAPFLSAAAMREIVESVVIAFVLAFLFRTFEAEAFVIPTGSMAPTLMGRHKDLVCENCGYPYQASASDEVDPASGRLNGVEVVSCTCPICHYTMNVDPDDPDGATHRSYKGDRILVAKFPYKFVDPQRWDVAVFHYPGGAKTNFIKRIVGLPNESILIQRGHVYVRDDAKGETDFTIARKPPHKVKAMLQPVYDNDFVQPELINKDLWPARWSPRESADDGAEGQWQTAKDDYRSFRTSGKAEEEVWLRYRHFVPSYEDWRDLKQGTPPPDYPPQPQLITDFTAYNSKVVRPARGQWAEVDEDAVPRPDPEQLGLHWVGDLAVECKMKVDREGGEAVFELVEGGRIFRCRIDLTEGEDAGKATLSIDGLENFKHVVETCIHGPGTYRIRFANVDDRLLLWVNRGVHYFDYEPLGNTRPQPEDLEPVRIGSKGAALEISHLKIYRDVYYIAQRFDPQNRGDNSREITDFPPSYFPYYPRTEENRVRVLSNPNAWDAFAVSRRIRPFELEADQFLALGDNSAQSKDSRLWGGDGFEYYVSRDLLIGKALVIYWPHSLDKIPGTSIPIRFFPNFWRMWFVE